MKLKTNPAKRNMREQQHVIKIKHRKPNGEEEESD